MDYDISFPFNNSINNIYWRTRTIIRPTNIILWSQYGWNMGYPFHRAKHSEAWEYLLNEFDPDVALLQETVPSDELEESGHVLWRVIKGSAFGTGIYSKSGGLKPW